MSRNREAAAAVDWDEGPPGAESDYAAHSGHPPQPAYAYPKGGSGDRQYAAYEPTPRAGGYRPASSESRQRPPLPPVRDADSSSARYRRGDAPDRAHLRRARSRSSSASEHSPRARSGHSPRARRTRHRTSSSSSSGSSERPPRRPRDSDRRKDTAKRNTKSHHCDKSDYQSNRTVVASNESSGNRDRSNKQKISNTSHKHRERSITPPKSYKRRTTSSSSSGSSSSDSRSASRSPSRSRRTRTRTHSRTPSQGRRTPSQGRRTPSQGRRTPSQGRRTRSRSRSCSASSASRGRTPSPRRHSDSSSSSRGCFSGYDRKRYFRKLKEQQAKEVVKPQSDEKTSEEKVCGPPAGAVRPDSEDVAQLEYGDPPPVDGVNFEDLPPPPAELCGRAASYPARKMPPVIPNDGSFLEMFKRMQEESQKAAGATDAAAATSSTVIKKPVLPLIGKRRGGRVLKTGLVKKVKAPQEPTDNAPKDAWSLYMQEVKKYRETSCEEERKTRPLVK